MQLLLGGKRLLRRYDRGIWIWRPATSISIRITSCTGLKLSSRDSWQGDLTFPKLINRGILAQIGQYSSPPSPAAALAFQCRIFPPSSSDLFTQCFSKFHSPQTEPSPMIIFGLLISFKSPKRCNSSTRVVETYKTFEHIRISINSYCHYDIDVRPRRNS